MDLGFLEHAPFVCCAFRRERNEFVLERVNAAARRGNPLLASLLGRPMAHLYDDQPAVIADAHRCVSEGVVIDHELAVRRHDRLEATLLLRLRFVPAPPDHLLLFVQELDHPDMARLALHESEARNHSLVASLPDAVLMRAADGRVLFCNDLALRLFGATSHADLLGKRDVLAPDVVMRDEGGVRVEPHAVPSLRVIAQGEPEHGLYSFGSHGDVRWMRVAAQPIRSGDGRTTGSVTTFTDVTERMVAQRSLRESAARLDLALAAARMGVWEYDPALDRGWWSPNLSEIFHFAGREPGLALFLDAVHPEDRDVLRQQLQGLTRGSDGHSIEFEFRLIGDDGAARWARVKGRLTLAGEQRMLAGTVMDITEQRLLEEQLHRASRLESIGRLAGGVAHDFNNLLAAMLGSLELLEGQVPEEAAQDLATIRHSALRARDLTRQLLAFARKQPVVSRTVDLSILVREVELLLRRLVGPRIAISIVAPEPALVSADPALLEQVLVNLVVNARDAMPEGGRLEIRVENQRSAAAAEPRTQAAVLTVTDSGVGMDESTQRRIFEPFFTTKSLGTGLGLASSYGIIEQHRGAIRVESAPGRGSRFIVTLPSLSTGEDTRLRSAPPEAPRRARGTILVVDDEDAVRRTTVRLVRSLGYEVLDAASAAQAVARAAEHPGSIDLLLCDIALPGEDGRELAAGLVGSRKELKVVFMSGYSSDMQELRVEGALFLQKPFSRDELARKLAEITGS
jgi:PAS domain S-box-containing protein